MANVNFHSATIWNEITKREKVGSLVLFFFGDGDSYGSKFLFKNLKGTNKKQKTKTKKQDGCFSFFLTDP